MSPERRIELSYEALKTEYATYVEDVLKTVGFLIVALGWILTSSDAQNTLTGKTGTNTFALVCVVVLALNGGMVLLGHFIRSRRLQTNLLKLAPDLNELVRHEGIQPLHVILNAMAVVPLFLFLLKLIWELRTP